MNGKLVYDKFTQLVGKNIRGNYIFSNKCAQEVSNCFGVKSFWSHPVPGTSNNQIPKSAVAITYSTCEIGLLLQDQCGKALNRSNEESVFPMMTLVAGGIKVTAIPLLDEYPREKAESIRKCVEMVHDVIAIFSMVLLVKQVDSSIFDNRGEIVTLDGTPMTIEDASAKLFPTLFGIHQMYPAQGCQPDISFVIQWTNVAKQLRILGLREYLVNHILDLIGPLQSIARTASMPCQRNCFGNSPSTTPRITTCLVRLNQMASAYRANGSYSQSVPLTAPIKMSTKPEYLPMQMEQAGKDGPIYDVMYSSGGTHPIPVQMGIYDNWASTALARSLAFIGHNV